MSEMVERVACALLGLSDLGLIGRRERERSRERARAAIPAMREPAREVLQADADAEFWPRSLGGEATACVGRDRAEAAWRAMIDEALR